MLLIHSLYLYWVEGLIASQLLERTLLDTEFYLGGIFFLLTVWKVHSIFISSVWLPTDPTYYFHCFAVYSNLPLWFCHNSILYFCHFCLFFLHFYWIFYLHVKCYPFSQFPLQKTAIPSPFPYFYEGAPSPIHLGDTVVLLMGFFFSSFL